MNDTYAVSIGQGALQSRGLERRELSSFQELFKLVCGELSQNTANPLKGESIKSDANTARKKNGAWFATPYKGDKRAKANCEPRRFVVLDVDECAKEYRPQIAQFCERWKCFIYESFSSSISAPRFRLVFDASRSILPEEMEAVTRFISTELVGHIREEYPEAWTPEGVKGLAVDPVSGQASRLFFAPPQKYGERAKFFNGSPIDVDAVLRSAPVDPTGAGLSHTQHGREVAILAEQGGTSCDGAKADPIPDLLKARGLLVREKSKGAGVWVCRCPCEADHTEEHRGAGDSSTVYYEAGTGTSQDGTPFRYGRFVCQHAHCVDRSPEEFFDAIGVDYGDYVRYISGDQADRFTSPTTGITYTHERGRVTALYQTKDGETRKVISQGLTVVARLADTDGRGCSLLIEWTNKHTRARAQIVVSEADLYNKGAEVVSRLVDAGFSLLYSGKLRADLPVIDYLRSYPMWGVALKTRVDRVGWCTVPHTQHGRVFVTSSRNFGRGADRAFFVGSSAGALALSERGSLEKWQNEVARPALLSSRIIFSIACAFSAPCLQLLGLEGGAFNLHGRSSKGKTTAQRCGASVYGNPGTNVKPWNSTGTALEVIANGHNDSFLCLDEAGTADGRTLGDTIYRLNLGYAKARGKVDADRGGAIGLRELSTPWRVLTLSASELTARQLLQSVGGKELTGGQAVRFVDIPAQASDARPEFGVFESAGEWGDTKELARALNTAVFESYGVAGARWLEYLSEHYDDAQEALKRYRDQFISLFSQEVGTPKATQALRALDRFAVVGSAGALASELGITGWSVDDALHAVLVCARASLSGRLNEDSEVITAVGNLYKLVTVHSAHFDAMPVGAFAVEETRNGECYGLRYYERNKANNNDATNNASADDATAVDVVDLTGVTTEEERYKDYEERFIIYTDIFRATVSPLSRGATVEFLEQIGATVDARTLPGKRERQARGVARLQRGGKFYAGYIIIKQKLEDFLNENKD